MGSAHALVLLELDTDPDFVIENLELFVFLAPPNWTKVLTAFSGTSFLLCYRILLQHQPFEFWHLLDAVCVKDVRFYAKNFLCRITFLLVIHSLKPHFHRML